jgi:hypothetical protein
MKAVLALARLAEGRMDRCKQNIGYISREKGRDIQIKP